MGKVEFLDVDGVKSKYYVKVRVEYIATRMSETSPIPMLEGLACLLIYK